MKNGGPEFTPEQVEQQIDLLARSPKTWSDPSSDARLISELYQVYSDDASITSRAWQRLAARVNATGPQPVAGNATSPAHSPMDARANRQKGPHIMQFRTLQKQPSHRLRSLLGFCATLLVVVALITGTAVVLNDIHLQLGPSSPTSAATKTPTPVVDEGKIVYHSGSIQPNTNIAWSPDGQRIAVASPEAPGGPWQLKSWDVLTGQHEVTYQIGNTLPLYGNTAFADVAWSPDGHSLAVVSFTGKVDIFDAQSGKLTDTFSPSLVLGRSLMSPLAASSSAVKSPLSSLLPQSGGPPFLLPEIVWSPGSTYLAESITGRILIWNASSGSLVKQMTDNSTGSLRMFWQPHGNLLAIIGCSDTTCTIESVAFIWDTTTGQLVKQYPGVSTLDWSPDGKQLALVGQDQPGVRIVEALTGQTVRQLPASLNTAIHWSPDGSRLAEESLEKITIWSIADGKLRYTFPLSASEVSWSPDNKYIRCIQDVKTSSGYVNEEIAIWIA